MKSNFFKYLIPRKDDIFTMNDHIETIFTTKDYKIKLIRINKTYQYSSYKYICYIKVYTILDIEVCSIKCTEIDIIKLIDTLYYSIDNNCDTYSFFSNIDTTGIYHGIKLDISIDSYTYRYNLSVLQYNVNMQSIITLVSITFDLGNIYEFLDLLYMTYLVHDVNISDYNIEDLMLSDNFLT